MNIGVDVGGTHTRVGVGADGKIEKKEDFPTTEFTETLEKIKATILTIADKQNFKVGVAVPGPIESKSSILRDLPNLPSWRNQPLKQILSEKLSTEVVIEHDASLAAAAEAKFGAGVGKNPVLYYTVSTGLGAGLFYNGQIYSGVYNPEPGHQIVTGINQPLEKIISGNALRDQTGKEPAEIVGSSEWAKALERLARGITNSILHYSPEIVIIGGGLTTNHDEFFPLLVEKIRGFLTTFPLPEITIPALEEDSTLIGALELAATT
jgi:predicted NBD/HSP70 family sugar kinase